MTIAQLRRHFCAMRWTAENCLKRVSGRKHAEFSEQSIHQRAQKRQKQACQNLLLPSAYSFFIPYFMLSPNAPLIIMFRISEGNNHVKICSRLQRM